MATAPIDVSLRVRGGRELDQLIKRMDRLETETEQTQKALKEAFSQNTFRGINQGTTSLNRFTKEAIAAQRQIDRLARSTKRVSSVEATVNTAASGSGSGAAAAALNAAALSRAASAGFGGQVKTLEEVRSLAKQIKKEFKEVEAANTANEAAANEVKQAYDKQVGVLSRIKGREEEIKEATRFRNAALGQQKSLLTRIEKGQIKNAEAVKKAKIEAAQFGATASDWNRKISDAKASVNGLNRELEKSNRLAKGFSTTPMRAPGVPKRGQAAPATPAPTGLKQGGGAALLGGSVKSVLGLAAAYVSLNAAIGSVNKSIQVSSDTKSVELRIKALSAEFDNYADVIGVVERAQAKFNIGNLEASNSVAQLYGRLRPLGLTLSEVETIYSGFNTATTLTGATASESAGALLQLTQALGAGALRGEEFNSVAEQAPAVLRAIGAELDVPIGQLKQLAKDGKLTSDVLLKALKRVEKEGAEKLAAALDTPAQKFKTLQNRTEELNKAFGDLILPAVIRGVEGLSGAAEVATKDIDKTALAMKTLNEKIQAFRNANPGVVKAIDEFGSAFIRASEKILPFIGQLRRLLQLRDELANEGASNIDVTPMQGEGIDWDKVDMYQKQMKDADRSLKDRLGVGDLSGGGGGGGGGGAAARESELPQLQRELTASDKLLQIDRARLEAQFQGNEKEIQRLANLRVMTELEAKRAEIAAEEIPDAEKKVKVKLAENEAALAGLEILYESKELEKQRAEAVEGILGPLDEEIQILQGRINGNEEEIKQKLEILRITKAIKDADPDADTSGVAAIVKQRDELAKQAEAAAELKAQYKSLANSVAGELTGAFKAIITGAKSAEEALSDAFAGIADAFLDMAFKMIQQWLVMQMMGIVSSGGGGGGGGGLPFEAGLNTGLPLFGSYAGGGYTGDGPRSGGVDGQGGFPAILHPQETVIDHSGAMGRYSPGGSSGSSSSGEGGEGSSEASSPATVIDVSYSVQRINQVDYVTAAEFQQGMNAAAKKGAELGKRQVYSDLTNKRSVRQRLSV